MTRSPRSPRLVVLTAALELFVLTGAAPKKSESWDAIYIANNQVGHIQTWIEPVTDKGRDLLRVRVKTELSFKRLRDLVTMKIEYGSIETLEGQVLRLDTLTTAAKQVIRVHGDVIDKKMNLIIDGGGQRQESLIDWPDDVRGPYAVELSLALQPIKAGEVRTLKMFMPDLNKICDVTLTAKDIEDVQLGGGVKRTLMRIEQTTTLDDKKRPEFDQTMWADSGGQVMKTRTDNLGGMDVYRTTREGALAEMTPRAAQFDQITNSVIKVKHKINRPDATRDVRYRLTLKSDEPAQIIPTDRRQSLTPGANKNEVILIVKSAGPDVGKPGESTVDPSYLRPNAMITSEDEQVIQLAKQAIGQSTDPWEKARKIEAWVARHLLDKNFQTAFAPASEVARTLSGDCTEHGVLVAAMCRAVQVPSRVVVGLVYAENLGGFGFHMWNEVYVNRRWVAIDASFEQDTVDAVHIKLADASLDGVSPFEALLPVVRVLGKMTLDPIEIR